MSTHNELLRLKGTLEQLVTHGRAMLSCEGLTSEDVDSYKTIVDGVLEETGMRLEDVDQMAASKEIERQEVLDQTASLESDKEEEDPEKEVIDSTTEAGETPEEADEAPVEETPEVPAELEPAEAAEPEADAEEPPPAAEEVVDPNGVEEEIEVPALNEGVATTDEVEADDAAMVKKAESETTDEHGNDVGPEDLENDPEIEDVDTDVVPDVETKPAEATPAEDLAATVDKVDHVVERVSTFISVTEDSGLTTDDIQAMAQTNDSFESIATLGKFADILGKTSGAVAIQAFHKLTAITIRNIGKAK